jgi:hypothetical protein
MPLRASSPSAPPGSLAAVPSPVRPRRRHRIRLGVGAALAPWRGAPRSRPRRTRGARRHPSDRGELPAVGLTRSLGSVSSPACPRGPRSAQRRTHRRLLLSPPPDRPQPRLGDPERSWDPSTRDSPARQPSPIGAIRSLSEPMPTRPQLDARSHPDRTVVGCGRRAARRIGEDTPGHRRPTLHVRPQALDQLRRKGHLAGGVRRRCLSSLSSTTAPVDVNLVPGDVRAPRRTARPQPSLGSPRSAARTAMASDGRMPRPRQRRTRWRSERHRSQPRDMIHDLDDIAVGGDRRDVHGDIAGRELPLRLVEWVVVNQLSTVGGAQHRIEGRPSPAGHFPRHRGTIELGRDRREDPLQLRNVNLGQRDRPREKASSARSPGWRNQDGSHALATTWPRCRAHTALHGVTSAA